MMLGDKKIINYRPIVAIALFLAFGIMLSLNVFYADFLIIAIVLTFISLILSLAIKSQKVRQKARKVFLFSFVTLIGLAVGLTQLAFFTSGVDKSKGNVFGTVESVSFDYNIKKVVLNNLIFGEDSVSGKAEVSLKNGGKVEVGDVLKLKGTLRNSKAISADKIFTYYVSNNIKYIGTCELISIIEKVPLNFSQKIRTDVLTALVDNLETQNAGIVMGMIFGDTSMMNATVTRAFQVSGLGHLFAVSGLNVGIFYSICFFLLKRFNIRVKSIVTLILVTLYVYICGMTTSATRALLMISVLMLTQNLNFEVDGLTNLAFAMIAVLLMNPFTLFSAGFALSFGAVLSLTILRPPIARIMPFKNFKTRDNWGGLIGIQILTLPLMSYYFSYISVFSLVINMVLIPVTSVVYMINLFIILLQQTVGINLLFLTNAMIELIKSVLLLIEGTGIAIIEYKFSQKSLFISVVIAFVISDVLMVTKKWKLILLLPLLAILFITLTL